MEIFTTRSALRSWLECHRKDADSVGFVPTMGALHDGHLELVRRSARENDVTVVSIFVNPIQFNNQEDLAKYPRSLDTDLEMLRSAGCHAAFTPTVDEMYPGDELEHYDFGSLEQVMEGAFRPGHFQGVAVVVKRLLEIAEPARAYFGEKDFQQLRIIQALVEKEGLPVAIVPCPTVREADGLAMSSRNQRLSSAERAVAPLIYDTLRKVKEMAQEKTVEFLLNYATERLNGVPGMQVEYFCIAGTDDLQPLKHWPDVERPTAAFVAVNLGRIRLIDNMMLYS
jgi:pantoate--beta-alanine ligase